MIYERADGSHASASGDSSPRALAQLARSLARSLARFSPRCPDTFLYTTRPRNSPETVPTDRFPHPLLRLFWIFEGSGACSKNFSLPRPSRHASYCRSGVSSLLFLAGRASTISTFANATPLFSLLTLEIGCSYYMLCARLHRVISTIPWLLYLFIVPFTRSFLFIFLLNLTRCIRVEMHTNNPVKFSMKKCNRELEVFVTTIHCDLSRLHLYRYIIQTMAVS